MENEKMNNHAKAEVQKHTAAKTFGAVSPAVMAEVTSAALSIFMKPMRMRNDICTALRFLQLCDKIQAFFR